MFSFPFQWKTEIKIFNYCKLVNIYIYIYIYRHTVLGSSVATSGDAISLTTFLSSVVVASLFSESNSSSVAKLYF